MCWENFFGHSKETLSTFPQAGTQKHHVRRYLESDLSTTKSFYLAKWYTSVIACLPPVFRDITANMPDFLPLQSAVLALSASYLAHIESSTAFTNTSRKRSRYIPQFEHRYRSLEFYDTGVRRLAELVLASQPTNFNYVLATSLLFQYFEMDSGLVSGAGGHMESIDNIVLSAYKDLDDNPTGQKLICTWMVLRSLVAGRRLSVGIGIAKLPSFIGSNELDCLKSKAATPYDSIMWLLCKSISLIRVILLDWCVCRGRSFMTPEEKHHAFDCVLTQVGLPQSRDCSASELLAIDDHYWKSLENQRAKLDEWHARLHISELPIDSFTSQTTDTTANGTTLDPQASPLRFHTHQAAMNYVYYALAQMLSSRRAVERLVTAEAPPAAFTSHDYPWENLILRITAGLDPADCVSKHIFNYGIVTMLSMCAAWCPHLSVAKAAMRWLSQLEMCGLAVEDGVPLTIIKRELVFIMEKKKMGQDLFRISALDCADMETGELYQSDCAMLAAVCAKDRRTGELYNEICEIP